jgi:hypothetical protein
VTQVQEKEGQGSQAILDGWVSVALSMAGAAAHFLLLALAALS